MLLKERPELSATDYEIWRELVVQRCGLYFTPSRRHFLQARLWDRMKVLQLKRYSDYYHYVLYNPQGEREWAQLLDLLLNNESSFFRHAPSFTALMERALPALMTAKREQDFYHLSLWSAGCANGQEAYSLAMAFNEVVPVEERDRWQVKVWGSDISQKSLTKARTGRYKAYDIRTMPESFRQKYLRVLTNGRQGFYDVIPPVKQMVQFAELNLAEADSYWITAQDIIFCQNVLIYFRPEERLEVVNRLCQRLNPGGYLFLAPAEVVGYKQPGIRTLHFEESLVYQRLA